jgi:hypothetical protein
MQRRKHRRKYQRPTLIAFGTLRDIAHMVLGMDGDASSLDVTARLVLIKGAARAFADSRSS